MIVNNTIVGYQKTGIIVQGAGSTATITGNTVTGAGPTTLLAQNGIQVSDGASATVMGNTVSGNQCNEATCGPDPLAQTQAVGILLAPAAAGTTVMGNTITANDIGIYNFAEGATTLTGNILTGNRFEGISLDEGDATVDANTIDGGNVGILAVSFAVNTANSNGTLTCNQISGAVEAGIRLLVETGSGFMPVVTATNNSITGNAVGLDNTTTPSVNAQQNWWGCPLGPGNPGCDTVNGMVDTSSPLAEPPPCASPTTTTTTSTTTTSTPTKSPPSTSPITTTTSTPRPPQRRSCRSASPTRRAMTATRVTASRRARLVSVPAARHSTATMATRAPWTHATRGPAASTRPWRTWRRAAP